MSDYGLRIRNSSGTTIFNSNIDVLSRIISIQPVAAGQNGSVELDLTDVDTIILSFVANTAGGASSMGWLAHLPSRNGNTISWTPRGGSGMTRSTDSIILVVGI